jgi:hypothetical protein
LVLRTNETTFHKQIDYDFLVNSNVSFRPLEWE